MDQRLIAGPPLRTGSDFEPVNTGFVVDKEAVGQISLRVLDFSLFILFPPMTYTHISFVYGRR
jgi:hypothetical protein